MSPHEKMPPAESPVNPSEELEMHTTDLVHEAPVEMLPTIPDSFGELGKKLMDERRERSRAGAADARTIVRQHEAIERAKIDALTGFRNRNAFEDEYPKMFARAKPGEFAIVIVDVANLKHANDNYGHQTGDRILQLAADRVRRIVRPNDQIYRIGGDEFAILMNGLDPKSNESFMHQSKGMVSRLQGSMNTGVQEEKQRADEPLPQELFTGLGVGVAIKYENDNVDTLFRMGDIAMETNKQQLYRESGVERRKGGLA